MFMNHDGNYIHVGETMSRASGSASFGELLNYLFATKLKPDGTRYKLREVADATGVSIGFLSEARHGNKENPPKELIESLADFFEVPPGYFFGPLPEETASLEAALQEVLVKPAMGRILLRAGRYSEVEREMLLDLMDSMERAISRTRRGRKSHSDDTATDAGGRQE